jgi:hypothetical protein
MAEAECVSLERDSELHLDAMSPTALGLGMVMALVKNVLAGG